MKFSAQEIAHATGGILVHGSPETVCDGVSIDSRTICKGQLFVPLRGSRCDGHDFIPEALRQGAQGFFFQQQPHRSSPNSAVAIYVHDTRQALSDLARWAVTKRNAHIIAVAGSNGKTTTKDLIAHVLAQRFRAYATVGNYNTELGLSLSTLNAPDTTEIFVLEMGATAPGDVRRLCQIAPPTIGVLTSISEEHTATLGTLREIIETETELLEALPPQGLAIINGDTPAILDVARRKARCRLMTFGFAPDNDFVAEDVKISREGTRFSFRTPPFDPSLTGEGLTPLLGRPAALAALAATAVAHHLGLSFSEILPRLRDAHGTWGRLQLVLIPDTSITVLHDAYNANPASMHEAILCAAQLRQPDEELLFVLGDMLELGSISERAHREIGRLITTPGLRPDQLVVVGSWARLIGEAAAQAGVRVRYCVAPDEVASALVSELTESAEPRLILLKGSRGMRLGKLLDALSHQRPLPV